MEKIDKKQLRKASGGSWTADVTKGKLDIETNDGEKVTSYACLVGKCAEVE